MDEVMIQHGRHLLIHEMAQESMPQLVGKSVRVVGRLKNIDAESGRVTLEMHGAEVNVDVVQAGQIEMKTSRPMLMFIGELERDTKCRDANDVILRARVVSDVSTLDTDLYEQCVYIQRRLFDE
mmetsp:Transcript_8603/g.25855  ORF Transcript_8603/g.25855 Transcript_8603/m.25855 type:complete len:124 (+) Transcript_8603:127-498(+)